MLRELSGRQAPTRLPQRRRKTAVGPCVSRYSSVAYVPASMTDRPGHRVTDWLARASPGLFATYAVTMAFTAYFAMYSFRKPFAAAHYADARFWILDLK